ncbi:MAG: translation initiation factor IF-2 N-terminal domain-containing protein, partial [Inhella sp.]
MAVTTVAQFATELNRPASTLLEQLQAAGVPKASDSDALTESDKERLLEHLRQAHGTGAERKKITLTRKTTSEIKQADASGKARTIQVEVKKKRTFIKREDVPGEDVAAAEAAEAADLARREEEARAQAEALAREQAELERVAREREEAERRAREEAEARAAAAAAAAAAAKAAEEAAAAQPKTKAEAKAEAKAAEPVPAPAPAEAKPAVRVVKAAAISAEEKAKQAELDRRRKAAEAEAAAIRAMMNAPKKVLVAKKPEEPKPAEPTGIKGTIHKKAGAPGAPAAPAGAKPGDKKSIKSEKLSSSWADDAKKRGAPAKGRSDAGAGRGAAAGAGWKAPRGAGRRGDRGDAPSTFVAPTEPVVQEVHIPETITVGDLAHKMSVKAAEVIKKLMQLGQMVTINQPLDQETAMFGDEERGHTAFAAQREDPHAFLEDEAPDGEHESG